MEKVKISSNGEFNLEVGRESELRSGGHSLVKPDGIGK